MEKARWSNWTKLLSVLLFSILIQGCGSGGDDEEPTSPKVEQTADHDATSTESLAVTISGNQQVTEGELVTLTANSDGATSFSWASGNLELSGADNSVVTFFAPATDEDYSETLSVTVKNDAGITATSSIDVLIKRKVSTITLTGLVTDKVIPNALVTLSAGTDVSETVTADENGEYSITFVVDEKNADKLVKAVAVGTGEFSDVEFVSLLPSAETLVSESVDGQLTSEENFGVNITNVTTAEFVLLERANQTDEEITEEQLTLLKQNINAKEKLQLAAVIKVIVDNSDFNLPEGVETVLEFANNEEVTSDFIDNAVAKDANILSETIEDIKNDETLTETVNTIPTGSYVIGKVLHFTINEGGKGTLAYPNNKSQEITWAQSNGKLTIYANDYLISSYTSYIDGENTLVNRHFNAVEIDIISSNGQNYDISYVATSTTSYPNIAKESEKRTSDVIIRSLVNTEHTLEVDIDSLTSKTWYVDNFVSNGGDNERLAQVSFDENGTASVTHDEINYHATWLVDNKKLTLEVPNLIYSNEEGEEVTGGKLELWLTKQTQASMEFATLVNGKNIPSGLWIKANNETTFTELEVTKGWLFHNAGTTHRYDLYPDGDLVPDWNWENQPYKWEIADDGQMLRYREQCIYDFNLARDVCFKNQEVRHKRIAVEGDYFYVARNYQRFSYDDQNSERVLSYNGWAITKNEFSEHYGHTRFNDWANGRFFYSLSIEDSKADIKRIDITDDGNGSWYNQHIPSDDAYLAIAGTEQHDSTVQYFPYQYVAGDIVYHDGENEKRLTIIDHQREFYTICHYETGATELEIENCTKGERLYFFDELSVAQEKRGQTFINRARFVGQTIYAAEFGGENGVEVNTMELSEDGTLSLVEESGTQLSGTYEFYDDQVLVFDVHGDGEDWNTFAVLTGYDIETNSYEYCFVDDEDNITAEVAKQACLDGNGNGSGNGIDELYFGAFLFDETTKTQLVKNRDFVGEYILNNMHLELDVDGTGSINYENSRNVNIEWKVEENNLTITPENSGTVFHNYSEWNDAAQLNYDYEQELISVVITYGDNVGSHQSVNYEVNSVVKEITGNVANETREDSFSDQILYNKRSTQTVQASDFVGSWIVENFVTAMGGNHAGGAGEVSLDNDGTGTFTLDNQVYDLSWNVESNRTLIISVPYYDPSQTGHFAQSIYSQFWFIEENGTYRSASQASNGHISEGRLFKVQENQEFTSEEITGGWKVDPSAEINSESYSWKYDLFPDGEFFYGWGYSTYNQWRIQNGDFYRFRTTCGERYGKCVEDRLVRHSRFATHGDRHYVLRQWSSIDQYLSEGTGIATYRAFHSHVVAMTPDNTYGVSSFDDTFEDTNSYVVFEGDNGLESEEWKHIASDHTGVPEHNIDEDGLAYLIKGSHDEAPKFVTELVDGRYTYTDNGIDYSLAIIDTQRHYLQVCLAEVSMQSENCENGESLYFYRNRERAEQHVEYSEISTVARFVNSMVVDKSFTISGDNEFTELSFAQDGSGTVTYTDRSNSMTWSVSFFGSLNITENLADGSLVNWNFVADSVEGESIEYKFTSKTFVDDVETIHKHSGTMTPLE